MHNRYHDLKKRCKRYYLKHILLYVAIIFIAAALVFLAFFFFGQNEKIRSDALKTPVVQKKESKSFEKVKQKPKKDVIKVQPNESNVTTENVAKNVEGEQNKPKKKQTVNSEDKNETKQEISTAINPTTKHLSPIYNFEIDKLYEKHVTQKQTSVKQEVKEQKKATTQTVKQPVQSETKKISLQSNSINTIDDKIKLYQQRPGYEKAFQIAKYFYKKSEYEKAITWCKKADKLKPADEQTFELYALSLYKLQRYDQALSLINYFLSMKISDNLESLKEAIIQKKL